MMSGVADFFNHFLLRIFLFSFIMSDFLCNIHQGKQTLKVEAIVQRHYIPMNLKIMQNVSAQHLFVTYALTSKSLCRNHELTGRLPAWSATFPTSIVRKLIAYYPTRESRVCYSLSKRRCITPRKASIRFPFLSVVKAAWSTDES